MMNKSSKISISTFFLLVSLIVIIIMGYYIYMLYNEKTEQTNKVTVLNDQVSSLQENSKDLQETIDTISNTINNTSNTTNSTSDIENTSSSSTTINTEFSTVEIGYNNIVSVVNGKPYIIPVDRDGIQKELNEGENYFYHKFEVENLKEGVDKVVLETLGTDPSETVYFIMKDGSLKTLVSDGTYENMKFTSKEVLPSSNKVTDLTMDNGILYAVTKNGEKVKVAESLN